MTYIDTSDTGQGSQLNKGLSYEIGFLCLNKKILGSCRGHVSLEFINPPPHIKLNLDFSFNLLFPVFSLGLITLQLLKLKRKSLLVNS